MNRSKHGPKDHKSSYPLAPLFTDKRFEDHEHQIKHLGIVDQMDRFHPHRGTLLSIVETVFHKLWRKLPQLGEFHLVKVDDIDQTVQLGEWFQRYDGQEGVGGPNQLRVRDFGAVPFSWNKQDGLS